MDSTQTLKALETEKELLEDFICLSEEQLLLLSEENLEGFDALLQKRAFLMMKLTAIESTLANWIRDIQLDPSVAPATLEQMSRLKDEIVRMANHVVEVDEQAHLQLNRIKRSTRAKIVDIRRRN
jgi:hypothetical protein